MVPGKINIAVPLVSALPPQISFTGVAGAMAQDLLAVYALQLVNQLNKDLTPVCTDPAVSLGEVRAAVGAGAYRRLRIFQ